MQFDIRTHLPPRDVARLLAGLTKPPSWRELIDPSKPYRGAVTASEFRLREVDQRRHHLNPFLLGTLIPDGQGTCVAVRMRPSWGAWLVLACFWGMIASQGGWLHMVVLGSVVGLPLMGFMSWASGHLCQQRMSSLLATRLDVSL